MKRRSCIHHSKTGCIYRKPCKDGCTDYERKGTKGEQWQRLFKAMPLSLCLFKRYRYQDRKPIAIKCSLGMVECLQGCAKFIRRKV